MLQNDEEYCAKADYKLATDEASSLHVMSMHLPCRAGRLSPGGQNQQDQ